MDTLFNGVAGPPAPKPRIVTKAAPKPERPVYSVEVINGSKHSEASFAVPEGKQ
jgi:hypothetical protein